MFSLIMFDPMKADLNKKPICLCCPLMSTKNVPRVSVLSESSQIHTGAWGLWDGGKLGVGEY